MSLPNDIIVFCVLSYIDFEFLCDNLRVVSSTFKVLSEAAAGQWSSARHTSSFDFDDVQRAARTIRMSKHGDKNVEPFISVTPSRITPTQVMWFRKIVHQARTMMRPRLVDIREIDITATTAKTLLSLESSDLNNIPISNQERYVIAGLRQLSVDSATYTDPTLQERDRRVAVALMLRAADAHDRWRLLDEISYIVSTGLDQYFAKVLTRDKRRLDRMRIRRAAIAKAVGDLEAILQSLSMSYSVDLNKQRVIVERRLILEYLTVKKKWRRCGTKMISSTVQATLQPLHMKLRQCQLYECTRRCGWAGC